jgi:ribonuclease HI
MVTSRTYKAYIDGSSRGNPGSSSISYIIISPTGNKVQHSEYIGDTTNNIAEYTALKTLLKDISVIFKSYKYLKLDIHCDSQLVINQMKGIWKCKDLNLQCFIKECDALIKELESATHSVTLTWIQRNNNVDANFLAQQASKLGEKKDVATAQ